MQPVQGYEPGPRCLQEPRTGQSASRQERCLRPRPCAARLSRSRMQRGMERPSIRQQGCSPSAPARFLPTQLSALQRVQFARSFQRVLCRIYGSSRRHILCIRTQEIFGSKRTNFRRKAKPPRQDDRLDQYSVQLRIQPCDPSLALAPRQEAIEIMVKNPGQRQGPGKRLDLRRRRAVTFPECSFPRLDNYLGDKRIEKLRIEFRK